MLQTIKLSRGLDGQVRVEQANESSHKAQKLNVTKIIKKEEY